MSDGDYDDFEEEVLDSGDSRSPSTDRRRSSGLSSSAASAPRRSRSPQQRPAHRKRHAHRPSSGSGTSTRSAASSSGRSGRSRSRSRSHSPTAGRGRDSEGHRSASTAAALGRRPSAHPTGPRPGPAAGGGAAGAARGPGRPTAAVQAAEADFDLFARTTFIAQHLAAVLPTAGEDTAQQVREFQASQHARLQAELQRWEAERQAAQQQQLAQQQQREADREARRAQAAEERRRREAAWREQQAAAAEAQRARQAALQEERRRQLRAAEEGRQSVLALAKLQAMVKQHSHGLELCAAESAALDISLGLLASPTALEAVAERMLPPLPVSHPSPSVAHQLRFGSGAGVTPNADVPLPHPAPHLPAPASPLLPSGPPPGLGGPPSPAVGGADPPLLPEPPLPLSARRRGSSHVTRVAQRRDLAEGSAGGAGLGEAGGAVPPPGVAWQEPPAGAGPGPPVAAARRASGHPAGSGPDTSLPSVPGRRVGDMEVTDAEAPPSAASAAVDAPPCRGSAPPLAGPCELAPAPPVTGVPPHPPSTILIPQVAETASRMLAALPPVDLSPLPPLPPVVDAFAHDLPPLPPAPEPPTVGEPRRGSSGASPGEDVVRATAAERDGLLFRFHKEVRGLRWQVTELRQAVQAKLVACGAWQAQEAAGLLQVLAMYRHAAESETLAARLEATEAVDAAAAKCRALDAEAEAAAQRLWAAQAAAQTQASLVLLQAQESQNRADVAAEQLDALRDLASTEQQAMRKVCRDEAEDRRAALAAEAAHHAAWQGALEARQRELEERHAAAVAKEGELEAAAAQWQLQLREVGLRLDHLRLQQQQAEAQREERRVEESRAQLGVQEHRQQLLQQESEWQAQTAAVRRQLEAQTAAVAEAEKRLQRREIAVQQEQLSLRTRTADLSDRQQQLQQQEARLRQLEAAFRARSELVTADIARQKRQVAEAWEQLQRKSVEVADHIGALNHLLVVSHSPLLDASVSQLGGSLKRRGPKAADAAADDSAVADATPSKPPSLADTSIASPPADLYAVFQATGSVPGWSLSPTPLE